MEGKYPPTGGWEPAINYRGMVTDKNVEIRALKVRVQELESALSQDQREVERLRVVEKAAGRVLLWFDEMANEDTTFSAKHVTEPLRDALAQAEGQRNE